ncbi:hypothetical protein GCM10010211_10250 [Streptomyces albospinus]|uniref:Uncharacterized protein n=1 Tax=Streptomyces albospinus TaxID=285515 RepID=A0ABQ2URJ9_9ACTN|nr:hypothetical protein GCM10010211_10250 [Streptomyces albospinus]
MPGEARQLHVPQRCPRPEIEAGQLVGTLRQDQATAVGCHEVAQPCAYGGIPADGAVFTVQADEAGVTLVHDDAVFRHKERRSGTPLMEISLPPRFPDHPPS